MTCGTCGPDDSTFPAIVLFSIIRMQGTESLQLLIPTIC